MSRRKCFEAEYIAYAGKGNLLIVGLLLLGSCVISYLLSKILWQLAIMIAAIVSFGILNFMDYFAFAGSNSKNSLGINLIKSAPYGAELFRKALLQDMINKLLFSVITICAVTVFVLCRPLGREFSAFFVILYAAAAFATEQLLLNSSLWITRKKGITMQAHFLIMYLTFFAGSLLFLPLVFISEEKSVLVMTLYIVIVGALAVLANIWLQKSCNKAYRSMFYDCEVSK